MLEMHRLRAATREVASVSRGGARKSPLVEGGAAPYLNSRSPTRQTLAFFQASACQGAMWRIGFQAFCRLQCQSLPFGRHRRCVSCT
eukprot:8492712-Pyramimonas_sp.AAC.1